MVKDLLLYIVVLPIVSGIVCLAAGDRFKAAVKTLASVAAAGTFGLVLAVFINKAAPWRSFGQTMLACDNLSAFIALAAAFMAMVVTIYSCGFFDKRCGSFFGYALMTLGASLAVAFANNLVLMLVFWGFLAAMLYLLTNLAGTGSAAAAGRKAFIIIGGTDALMLFGAGLVWIRTGTLSMDAIHIPLADNLSYIAYFSIAIAALAKAGAIPFHSWLPDVAEDAPTPVGAYLPAALDKLLGIYLLARASLGLFAMSKISNTALLIIGSVTVIVAVMLALVQHNFKRLLGYHAVSQVGYMVIGIGTANPIGIAGALFHMLNNALYKSCLFLTGGAVEKKAHTLDLGDLGGLAKYMPVTFVSCLVAALSISGIPPMNGFFSKWMIYQGVIESASPKNPLWTIWLSAAMFGSALTIASFMKLIHTVFLGRPSVEYKDAKDPGPLMAVPMLALAVICVVFGVFAFLVPIPMLIRPVMGRALVYAGSWQPVAATVAMAIVIIGGGLSYILFRPGKFRATETFVGGADPGELGRVSGTEFYDTIKDIAPVGALYKKEESGSFDIYSISGKALNYCVKPLQILHNGVLPTYLVWCLLGMVAMFLALLIMAG
jgi:formate hydrogenlyase subunit 3/multisubunit Na+/H+ antiporter MnhD subunit